MKKCIVFLMLMLVISSCNDDDSTVDNTSIVGTWKITEALADPGDGSGKFRPVNSKKTLFFFNDGGVTVSNGNFCTGSLVSGEIGSGTFLLTENKIHADCVPDLWVPISFKLENGELTLFYPCFEGCGEKYQKISDSTQL